MSYPDPDRTYDERPRFVGEGFRVEPEFRVGTGAPEYTGPTMPITGGGFSGPGGMQSPDEPGYVPSTRSTLALPHSDYAPPAQPKLTASELEEVFDNPEHGEPGRDRFGVHACWEVVLLLATLGVGFALTRRHSFDLDSATIHQLMMMATVVGLLGLGAGLTLRAGAVNLAMGPVMVTSALWFGSHRGDGLYVDAVTALALAAGIGLLIGVITVTVQVPGWVVSLGAFLGLQAWLNFLPAKVAVETPPDPTNQAYVWFGGFAVVAIGGAVIGSVHSVRRAVGRTRSVSDPADMRGVPAAVVTAAATLISSVLAALAGILLALSTGGATSQDGLSWSGLAVAIALVGGTSAFGRRGGITGTVLAACLFVLVSEYVEIANWRVDPNVLIGGAIVVGVGVTRLVETFGRPEHSTVPADESAAGWLSRQPANWSDHRALELTRGEELARGGDWTTDAPDESWPPR